jgi:hypothetical protein
VWYDFCAPPIRDPDLEWFTKGLGESKVKSRQLLANGAMATFVFRIGPVSREGAGYSRSGIKSRWRSNASSVDSEGGQKVFRFVYLVAFRP